MENEALIRLTAFIGLFVLFAGLEWLIPRREQTRGRWGTNWLFVLTNTAALRGMAMATAVLIPFVATLAAVDAGQLGIGLFNLTALPLWVEIVAAMVILDFVVWANHVLFHKWDFLWRIHRVHHADEEMDVTTAIRFHPFEALLSMAVKVATVYALGAPVIAVILFEIILNGSAMFNHANLRLPERLDRVLRLVWVTPDMHRIHHAVDREEHDSNYGFALSIWDRLFGTYTHDPKDGHEAMKIGLRWRNGESRRFGWSLLLPFRRL
ncbi:MAG: sterol desaturase family protein [Pseudomonadota bacterium]